MNTITIRASSLPDLFDCPARWEARHIRRIYQPSSSQAAIGKAVHRGTAAFDASRLNNNPISPDEAAGEVVDSIYQPDEDIDWGEESPRTAEKISLALHGLYCEKVAPTLDYVAIEAECPALEITDLGLTLTGTTDRVYQSDDGLGIADIKTGKTAVKADGTVATACHAAQIAVYELLTECVLGQPMEAPARIIGLQTAKTGRGQRAGIGNVQGARDLLLGDDISPGILQNAAKIVHSGLFYGNPQSNLCHQKYCPVFSRCKWRK